MVEGRLARILWSTVQRSRRRSLGPRSRSGQLGLVDHLPPSLSLTHHKTVGWCLSDPLVSVLFIIIPLSSTPFLTGSFRTLFSSSVVVDSTFISSLANCSTPALWSVSSCYNLHFTTSRGPPVRTSCHQTPNVSISAGAGVPPAQSLQRLHQVSDDDLSAHRNIYSHPVSLPTLPSVLPHHSRALPVATTSDLGRGEFGEVELGLHT